MNVSIIGPENSGKTTLTKELVKRGGHGRPVFFVGKLKSEFHNLDIKSFHKQRNAVNIFDDANAFMETYDLFRKDEKLKEPIIMSRHYNLLNIFVFHSEDDAIKFFFRQSRYIYISSKYRDKSVFKNKFIQGIEPELIGREPFTFLRFKRY